MRVLVLSGGGSRGAWQAGAASALLEKHTYDAIVGTSVGSVNGAAISLAGSECMLGLWRGLKSTKDVMKFNWDWPWKWTGWYQFGPLEKQIRKTMAGRKFSTPVYAVRTDYQVGAASAIRLLSDTAIDAECTVRSIIESSSVPAIHRFTGRYMDGGLLDVAAVEFAYQDLKATEVDAVLCDPMGLDEWKPKGVTSVLLRSLEMMVHETLREDVEEQFANLRIFRPLNMKTNSIEYVPAEIEANIVKGYTETRAALG